MAHTTAAAALSNSLVAALKQAQAHQRRGAPEQQQPLLAVKVELDQLAISVLDNPGISRVMREARFSSSAVKAAIEEFSSFPDHNLLRPFPFLNSRLQNPVTGKQGNPRDDELKKLLEAMMRSNRRNPALIIHSEPKYPPGMIPRYEADTHLSKPGDPSPRKTFCTKCSENYVKELAKLTAMEKSFSEAKKGSSFPQWLQNATDKTTDAQVGIGLHKKWSDICLHLHHKSHPARTVLPALSLINFSHVNSPNEVARHRDTSFPSAESPIVTDLVLGRKRTRSKLEKVSQDQTTNSFGSISSEQQRNCLHKSDITLEAETYRMYMEELMEKVWWQAKAASAITRCRSDSGRRRGSRGDIWLLFTGPDRVGKRKIATVLAEEVCRSTPVIISLGMRQEDGMKFRGKTVIDRITEVVQRNPFSLIVLEDTDEQTFFF